MPEAVRMAARIALLEAWYFAGVSDGRLETATQIVGHDHEQKMVFDTRRKGDRCG